jgi:VanZ family protein
MHKTSAWPLALFYAGLIAYASLYPFADWRDQGVAAWSFLWQAWPKYWTGFDVGINVIGYAPFGFLLAVSALRTGRSKHPVWLASLTAAGVSLLLEGLQNYLPSRVSSNVDFLLNAAGGALGAGLAAWLERAGVLMRWSRIRQRWLVPDARGGLVLLALWPVALLFPSVMPLGLGQVMERLEAAVADLLLDTPFLDWLPVRDVELQPMLPATELICVLLGALIPCLLGFCIVRTMTRRAVLVVAVIAAGVTATALSWALSYGPAHAWGWVSLPVQVGLVAATLLALVLVPMPRRGSAALLLLGLGVYLSLLNQAPTGPYFAQTLMAWEQGQFIRFHGLSQWLGWLWPYAALGYGLALILAREPHGSPEN